MLKTRSVQYVSNPLGWDGDLPGPESAAGAGDVSNPLGWDGDGRRMAREPPGDRVSNPLGWDGDSGILNRGMT